MEKNNKNAGVKKLNRFTSSVWLILCFSLFPNIVQAGPIEDGVDWVLDLLTNGIARSVAIIGIAILGYMAFAGRLTGESAVKFILGIVLIFGGAAIVDLLIAAVQ
ncbi:MAG: TrbC/VirB2 family protein [Pseudomonadota bacterium]